MEQVQPYINQLDAKLSTFPSLKKLEEVTKVPKVYSTATIAVILLISTLVDLYAPLVSNVYILAYPIIRALDLATSSSAATDELKSWVSYFALFAVEATIEPYLAPSVPFFYFIKVVVFSYLFIPETGGIKLVHGLIASQVPTLIKPLKTE
ncbi:hypothetical protein BJ742DRAFT_802793 [Cladochytrium replicatum]|nr:hypothetical protein BJ742DRAFT_802793 [Cladochytrium replicatum]